MASVSRGGFTLIEVLIVIALVGTLAAIGVAFVRPPASSVYANDLRALIQQARFEAVKINAPVAVLWDDTDEVFLGGVLGPACTLTRLTGRVSAADFTRVVVTPGEGFDSGEGLVWLPSGQARNCTFGPFPSTIASIDDGRVVRQVSVNLTGRVTIQ